MTINCIQKKHIRQFRSQFFGWLHKLAVNLIGRSVKITKRLAPLRAEINFGSVCSMSPDQHRAKHLHPVSPLTMRPRRTTYRIQTQGSHNTNTKLNASKTKPELTSHRRLSQTAEQWPSVFDLQTRAAPTELKRRPRLPSDIIQQASRRLAFEHCRLR